jgi:hypothetical protein
MRKHKPGESVIIVRPLRIRAHASDVEIVAGSDTPPGR